MATSLFNRKRTAEENAESSRLYRLGGIGAEFAGAVMGMSLIGYLLDLWWDTEPAMLITGAIIGLVGGLYNFLKEALRENRRYADSKQGNRAYDAAERPASSPEDEEPPSASPSNDSAPPPPT